MSDDLEARLPALIDAVGRRDEGAFAEVYDAFERPVYAVALRTVRDPQRAEEVVQDTFVKLWRNALSFESDRGSPSGWLFTIARRSAIDVLRREQRVPTPTDSLSEHASRDDDMNDLDATWSVNLALGRLPGEQRAAIDMFVIEGYTHTEVAERLGVPLGTVKTRIYTGLRHLRSILERDGLLGAQR